MNEKRTPNGTPSALTRSGFQHFCGTPNRCTRGTAAEHQRNKYNKEKKEEKG
jgi:hypothetical protein